MRQRGALPRGHLITLGPSQMLTAILTHLKRGPRRMPPIRAPAPRKPAAPAAAATSTLRVCGVGWPVKDRRRRGRSPRPARAGALEHMPTAPTHGALRAAIIITRPGINKAHQITVSPSAPRGKGATRIAPPRGAPRPCTRRPVDPLRVSRREQGGRRRLALRRDLLKGRPRVAIKLARQRAISRASGVLELPPARAADAPTDVITAGYALAYRAMGGRAPPGEPHPRPAPKTPIHLTDGVCASRVGRGAGVGGNPKRVRPPVLKGARIMNRIKKRHKPTRPREERRPDLVVPHKVRPARVRATRLAAPACAAPARLRIGRHEVSINMPNPPRRRNACR